MGGGGGTAARSTAGGPVAGGPVGGGPVGGRTVRVRWHAVSGSCPDAAPLRWLIMHDGPAAGARNMALDHALASALPRLQGQAARETCVLRLYEWEEPTLSFGRNEPARDRFRPAGLVGPRGGTGERTASVPACVRRPTGGRTVRHAGEITYAVVVPDRSLGGPRPAYRRIHEALRAGLALLGVDVTHAPDGGVAARPDAGPCFGLPAPGELVTPAGKIAGSAQARIGAALLQHGSLLVSDDQATLGEGARAATLESLVGTIDRRRVREAVEHGFRTVFPGSEWRPWTGDDRLEEEARGWERDRYGDEGWTWRR